MNRRPAFLASALVAGLIFGAGLGVSGMTDPAKIKAFLDVAAIRGGTWDPSLAFVMAAAVIVTMAALRVAHRRRQPMAAPAFANPPVERIDRSLVLGSVIFGVGWGLSGLCPGPAVANIVSAFPSILIFLAAMLAGATLVNLWRARRRGDESGDGAS